MAWSKSKSLLVALVLGHCCLIAQAAPPIAVVSGTVTDAKGAPLEGVTVQLSGMEKFRGGVWEREIRSGWMPSYTTDAAGRFELPFNETDIRYDLWFDKRGFAPTFLFGISAKSQELKVVLKRGTPVTGIVTRLVDARREPVSGTMVELRLSSEDLWYKQRAFTDHEGRYTLRISPPPKERKWFVVFAGEAVELEVRGEEPVIGPDFVFAAVRPNKTAPSSASVNAEGPFKSDAVHVQPDKNGTEKEVTQNIIEGYEYLNEHSKWQPNGYSKHGALEFWSSGGLLHEVSNRDTGSHEWVKLSPKHIRVITLVEGQAAVAHFYVEGAMKPIGGPAVMNYRTRATQVYVKEDGEWKVRSSHWSPVSGGSGTSQNVRTDD